jgi:hypothetical protein
MGKEASQMELIVKEKFNTYPPDVRVSLVKLRELIFKVAKQDGIAELIETLKWGEPTYISQIGSAVRIDWKAKTPEQYCIYFNCKTSLVDTFREIYGDTFRYEGNRAIVLKMGQNLPYKELSHCISMSLRYKKIKHLNLLGG